MATPSRSRVDHRSHGRLGEGAGVLLAERGYRVFAAGRSAEKLAEL